MCSVVPELTVGGYIDSARETTNIAPTMTDMTGIELFNRVFAQNFIIDVSNFAAFRLYANSAYTGTITIHLSQDKMEVVKPRTKNLVFTLENKTGNLTSAFDVGDYNKAVIQFKSEYTGTSSVRGYVDGGSNYVSCPLYNLDGTPASKITGGSTVVADVSNVKSIYLANNGTFTGDIYILLSQDQIDRKTINERSTGVFQIATQYVNVVDGTNTYNVDVNGLAEYRFFVVEVKRRDGSGYAPWTGTVDLYHTINKEQGTGPTFVKTYSNAIEVEDAPNGFAKTQWLENYTDSSIRVALKINGTTFDGALMEVNVIGIK